MAYPHPDEPGAALLPQLTHPAQPKNEILNLFCLNKFTVYTVEKAQRFFRYLKKLVLRSKYSC